MVFIILTSVFNSRWRISANSIHNLVYFLVGSDKSSYPSMDIKSWRIKSTFITISDILFNYEQLSKNCCDINWINILCKMNVIERLNSL